jgi:ABC-2 type transport system ATP-binding protein
MLRMEKTKPIISVHNLVKKFGDNTAVKGVSFDVQPGERFAFLGPNGAGKSTTIAMLTTVLRRTSGTVELAGFDPEEHPYDVRRNFGIVFQDDSHDEDLTAYENMIFHAMLYGIPREGGKERVKQALDYVDLLDRANDRLRTFSGGMKRRLEIARSLLHQPKILFLDEPTLGLDPQTRNYLWGYVTKLSEEQGMTVFFTTHYMQEAQQYADRIAIIDHGEIKAMGTAESLMQQTNTSNLEEAFLELTGRTLRDEGADSGAIMRKSRKLR